MRITRRRAVSAIAGAPALLLTREASGQDALPEIERGPFDGSLEGLKAYQIPQWFKDAKFGIWAHWGPQSAAEDGDWYARNMYIEDSPQYKDHLQRFGHPSKVGHKEICRMWTAEKFDPDHLMSLYKKAGAKYFMSMGVHHDNFDLWNSKHQPRWNAVATGPKKDIVGLWKKAAQKQGLRFAVSEHLAPSYNWFAVSHGSDKTGPLAGVPYDGTNPEYKDLYHELPAGYTITPGGMGGSMSNVPLAWKTEYFLRIKDLVDNYQPDLLYTDGGISFGEIGARLVSHFYNVNARLHGGKVEAVYTSKRRNECETGTCVYDIERGVADGVMANAWQTDTCIGTWHYKRDVTYKTPKTVIDMLCDIVSRNGNLMLNFPLPNNGELDAEELKILDEITKWMAVNGEGIYATRPWKTFGAGPSLVSTTPPNERFNERNRKDLTADDIRFTTKGNLLYAFVMGWPGKAASIPSLAAGGKYDVPKIRNVDLLGHKGKLTWHQDSAALKVELPEQKPGEYAIAFRIALA
ncbi:MAG TPA: alpha-L-fucosidase [Bryobacteraceae bacterium]|nr:alpha-L-fucosidase [Bryobacteraceae bacterium]